MEKNASNVKEYIINSIIFLCIRFEMQESERTDLNIGINPVKI